MRNEKIASPLMIDKILDPNNMENIKLKTDGHEVEFEQLAFIEYKENYYTILKPVDEFEDLNEDDAYIFEIVNDEKNDVFLKVEEDEEIKTKVATIYLNSAEKARKKLDS